MWCCAGSDKAGGDAAGGDRPTELGAKKEKRKEVKNKGEKKKKEEKGPAASPPRPIAAATLAAAAPADAELLAATAKAAALGGGELAEDEAAPSPSSGGDQETTAALGAGDTPGKPTIERHKSWAERSLVEDLYENTIGEPAATLAAKGKQVIKSGNAGNNQQGKSNGDKNPPSRRRQSLASRIQSGLSLDDAAEAAEAERVENTKAKNEEERVAATKIQAIRRGKVERAAAKEKLAAKQAE